MNVGEPNNNIEQSFDSLNDAITYAFRQEQTSLLSLDRICEVLQSPNLYFNSKKQGLMPCSSITRRRISSALSSCELFVRAGPPRTCLWAIRPHNPLFLSDGTILASIEQMLTENGPMTIDEFVNATQLAGADANLYSRFLTDHSLEFTVDEATGKYWFAGQPRPFHRNYESISQALVSAFIVFPNGASVEELHWFLCLSTVGGTKPITRRCVSRELSRRQDLFAHLSRARYILLSKAHEQNLLPIDKNQQQIQNQPQQPQNPPVTNPIPINQIETDKRMSQTIPINSQVNQNTNAGQYPDLSLMDIMSIMESIQIPLPNHMSDTSEHFDPTNSPTTQYTYMDDPNGCSQNDEEPFDPAKFFDSNFPFPFS